MHRGPLPDAVGNDAHYESADEARVPRARSATAGAPGNGRGISIPAELYLLITERLSDATAEVERLTGMRDQLIQNYGPFDLPN